MSFVVDERRVICVPFAYAPDVVALTGLVWSIVDDVHLRSGTIERDDLFQVGMETAVRAAARYRPDSPATFSTFAQYRIRGAMQDYLRSERPGSRRYPGVRPLSLDESVGDQRDGQQMLLGETLPSWDPEPLDPLLLVQLWTLIDALPDVMSRAVRLCAEAELTMQDIAAIEGVTVAAISHRLTRARAILQPRIERLLEPTTPAERPPLPFIGFVNDSEGRLTRQRRFSPGGRRVRALSEPLSADPATPHL
jgi:RNA polymerase sigma factor (sigma-70 family)